MNSTENLISNIKMRVRHDFLRAHLLNKYMALNHESAHNLQQLIDEMTYTRDYIIRIIEGWPENKCPEPVAEHGSEGYIIPLPVRLSKDTVIIAPHESERFETEVRLKVPHGYHPILQQSPHSFEVGLLTQLDKRLTPDHRITITVWNISKQLVAVRPGDITANLLVVPMMAPVENIHEK